MPLFKVKISIQSFTYIAVAADSVEDAMRYANSTDEWHEDGAVFNSDSFEEDVRLITAHGAEQITSPAQCRDGWDANTLCWGYCDDLTLAEAFYGFSVIDIDSELDDAEYEKALDAKYEKLEKLKDEFNEAKTG